MNLQEDFCSQELYKLLIDKGFEVDCYDAPFTQRLVTHQMTMKWLREVHKIDIFIDTDFPIDRMKYTYKIVRIYKDGDKYTDVMGGSFDTYEGAVEAAIKYSLENLI